MRVNGRKVIASGALVTNDGDDTFELECSNLTFKFVLTSGSLIGTTEPKVEGVPEGSFVRLTLHNFDNPLGTSWFSSVGAKTDAPSKKLYLAIQVRAIGTSNRMGARLINYTFSEEE